MVCKLRGNVAPFMMGMVLTVATVSTITAKQYEEQNNKNKEEYLKSKKDYINKANKDIETVFNIQTDHTNSNIDTYKIRQGTYTNIFSTDSTSVSVNQVGADGNKKAIVGLNTNEFDKRANSLATNANIQTKDLSADSSYVDEENIRQKQVMKSYIMMKDLASKLYEDVANSSEKKFACNLPTGYKNAWNEDFSFNRIDDYNAQLSFNLPWDRGTSKVLDIKIPARPLALDEVIAIEKDRSSEFTALITKNGKVFAAGDNREYLIGDGSFSSYDRLVWTELANLSNIVKMEFSAEFGQGMALDASGKLFVVGENSAGQLGIGTTSDQRIWVETASDVEDFYSFYNDFTYIKKKDGTVWGAGKNVTTSGGGHSQLGQGSDATANYTTWVQIPELTGLDSITYHFYSSATSYNYYAKMKDGRVLALGYNHVGQFNTGDSNPVSVWTDTGITDVKEVQTSLRGKVVLALKNDGTLWGNGFNSGIFNNGTTVDETSWTQIVSGVSRFMLMGYGDTLYIEKTDGTIHAIGDNTNGQLGNGLVTSTDTTSFYNTGLSNIKEFYSNTYGSSVYFLTNDGEVIVAGSNSNGSIGAGAVTRQPTFLEVVTDVKEMDINIGYGSITVIKNDGTLWSTGNGPNGQLGMGDTTARLTFTQVPNVPLVSKLMGISDDSTGVRSYYFIDNDKAIWSAGYNNNGQLGVNSKVNQSVFTKTLEQSDLGGGGSSCP
tara:strand:+ start:829 stop:2985 length:2157 start_codon:yes stop_codon:yes gene_type:complete